MSPLEGGGGLAHCLSIVCQAARKVREPTATQRWRWKVSTPPHNPPGPHPRLCGVTWAYKYVKRSGRNCSRVFTEALGGRGVVLRGAFTS